MANIPLSSEGTSLLDLREVASRLGLDSEIRRCTVEDLDRCPIPAIVYIPPYDNGKLKKLGHFVIICKHDNSNIYVIDGTFGSLEVYSTKDFQRIAPHFSMLVVGHGGLAMPETGLLLSIAGLLTLIYKLKSAGSKPVHTPFIKYPPPAVTQEISRA